MRIEIDNKIGEQGAWAEGVRRANEILKMIPGRSGHAASANWELKQDEKGRPFVSLTLADYAGTVADKFTPDDLKNSEHLWERLHHLWGDLLQVRSRKQLDELLKPEPLGKDA